MGFVYCGLIRYSDPSLTWVSVGFSHFNCLYILDVYFLSNHDPIGCILVVGSVR